MLPQLYMIGGPNGAGKTTIAFQLLPKLLSCYEYINDIKQSLVVFISEACL